MLRSEQSMLLPPDNKLPPSFKKMVSSIRPFLVPLAVYHVCPNGDYVFFRDEDKDLAQCPKCSHNRLNPKRLPFKTIHYMPVGPRLSRLYACPLLAQQLQSHSLVERQTLKDIQDTETWRDWYSPEGIFQGDPRGLALGMSTDGVNPFKTIGKESSIWPIYVNIFNLPPVLRNQMGNIMLCGVIEGEGKKEPAQLHPYIDILTHELMSFSGSRTFDAFRNEVFSLKVALVRQLTDFMGRCKLLSSVGPMGFRACPWCKIRGVRCHCLGKTIFPGNRRFLESTHQLRLDEEAFPTVDCNPRGGIILMAREMEGQPGSTNYMERVDARERYQAATNKRAKAEISKEEGVLGCYALQKLPYHDEVKHTLPDGMHVIKQSLTHIMDLMCARSRTVHPHEVADEVHRVRELNRYWLTDAELREADRRASEVITPCGSSYIPGPVFSTPSALPNTAAVHEVG